MSINEMDSKIKELRELRRMADELAAEMEAIQDSIKEEAKETLACLQYFVATKRHG